MLTEERRKMCLIPFFKDDSVLLEEIGKLMALNQIRGLFPLNELKILGKILHT